MGTNLSEIHLVTLKVKSEIYHSLEWTTVWDQPDKAAVCVLNMRNYIVWKPLEFERNYT